MLVSGYATAFDRPRQAPVPLQPRDRSPGETASLAADPRLLLASIVHDFNNLLTPVVSVLDELQGRRTGTPRQLQKIDAAIYCAFRAKILARQLLDFANPRPVNPEPVDVGELLELLEPALASVLSPDIGLEVAAAEDLPRAFVDRQFVERALLNLVLNARDAMPKGGDVTISATLELPPAAPAHRHERMIRLSVADCGTGMGGETLRMAGQPNFSTKTNGTGLGLATVRQLMESLGGGLSITSTPGKGASIDLWLPAMSAWFAD
jgi:signal transduction histidine kinase